MDREYKVPSRRQPVFACFKWFFKLLYKSHVINPEGTLPEKAIIISNHSAKSGPMAIEVSFPMFNVKWGAHEMLGNYKSRFLYLRNVLYMQKLKKSKLVATLKASYEAVFSIWVYRGMKFIPTYTDIRFTKSIKYSQQVLDSGASVLIFPEDSSEGYFDELTHAFAGFVMLADHYRKKCGVDVPILPLYYHKKTRSIYVGKTFTAGELYEKGLSREEIAEYGKNEINKLYYKHVLGKTEKNS